MGDLFDQASARQGMGGIAYFRIFWVELTLKVFMSLYGKES